jgi:polysaccharide export outer membrane protein
MKMQEPPVVRFEANDIVEVDISSTSEEAALFFSKSGSNIDRKYSGNTYQVAADGTIELPLIGPVVIADKTAPEAAELLRTKLLSYLREPTVNVRLVSFQITVLGEVEEPGVYDVPDAEITVLEALGYAGDLTIYGKRDNILIMRNTNGVKEYFRVNLSNTDFIESNQYYLHNHDVVYVQPSKGKTSADDNAYRILPLLLSSLTFIAVIISLTQ